jgi:hypothetical protein
MINTCFYLLVILYLRMNDYDDNVDDYDDGSGYDDERYRRS